MLQKMLFGFLITAFVINPAEARKSRIVNGFGQTWCDVNGDKNINPSVDCITPGGTVGDRCRCNASQRTTGGGQYGSVQKATPAHINYFNSLPENEQIKAWQNKGTVEVNLRPSSASK